MTTDGIKELIKSKSITEFMSRSGYALTKISDSKSKMCCPFEDHDDGTASFHVYEDSGTFNCFGCGRGGDIFNFVQTKEGLNFPEAKKRLMGFYGIEKQKVSSAPDLNKTVLNWVAKLYQDNLSKPQAKEAKEYLLSRGISEESIKAFGLGFVGSKPFVIPRAKVNKDIMKSLGIISEGDNGEYELFRNRVIFPLVDERNNAVGFAGRVLGSNDKKAAKYINSPASETFDKSNFLYGLNQAIDSGKALECIYVHEGYLDVIACHQVGLKNSVAACGTAVTEKHLNKLFEYCDNVVFVFDGDEAGKKALKKTMYRALKCVTLKKHVSFCLMNSGDDAAEILAKGHIGKLKSKLEITYGYEEFFINELRSIEGRTDFVRRCNQAEEITSFCEHMNGALAPIFKEYLERNL